MKTFNDFMNAKLIDRQRNSNLRELSLNKEIIDFSSNDYLGIAKKNQTGSTGSRLISGNSKEIEELEIAFSEYIGAEHALFFHSGYQANIGLIPALTDRNSTIFYDEYIHASLRDGIQLSHAKSYSFKHNDISYLEERLKKTDGLALVIVESVYSMDGDSPDLIKLMSIARKYGAEVIVDEAHALGVIGEKGIGLVGHLKLENEVLAAVYPLGKALGSSGAFVTGSKLLRNYLINFCRSFIFSTAPSNTIVNEVKNQLELLIENNHRSSIIHLKTYFLNLISDKYKVNTGPHGAIVSLKMPGNFGVKKLELGLLKEGIFVKSIMHPTVQMGEERLRICFHQFNSKEDVDLLISFLNRSE